MALQFRFRGIGLLLLIFSDRRIEVPVAGRLAPPEKAMLNNDKLDGPANRSVRLTSTWACVTIDSALAPTMPQAVQVPW
jgi:hypothetical protein